MDAILNDLRFAHSVRRAVDVYLLGGEKIGLTDALSIDEDAGVVNLLDSQHFGDEATTRKVPIDLIASVTVTDTQLGSE
jgi:hypothetical protein